MGKERDLSNLAACRRYVLSCTRLVFNQPISIFIQVWSTSSRIQATCTIRENWHIISSREAADSHERFPDALPNILTSLLVVSGEFSPHRTFLQVLAATVSIMFNQANRIYYLKIYL